MQIVIPQHVELLTGRKAGMEYARKNPLKEGATQLEISVYPETLITASWFRGLMESFKPEVTHFTLDGGSHDTCQEFADACESLVDKFQRQRIALVEVKERLKAEFSNHTDYLSLVKNSGEVEYSLPDFFEAKRHENGEIKLIDDVDHYFKRTLNRHQLAAVIVSLIDLSLGD